MSAINVELIPNVLASSHVEALIDRVNRSSTALETAMIAAHDRWLVIGDVFDVAGAEGAPEMLDPSLRSVIHFMNAMTEARRVLEGASDRVLPDLKSRRNDLVERAAVVNAQFEQAVEDEFAAAVSYRGAHDADPVSVATTAAQTDLRYASHGLDVANRAVEELKYEIERFRKDVESCEEEFASDLRRITGGDAVEGAWGEELRTSQSYWGFAEASYPSGPATQTGLTEHMRETLTEATVSRINWLSVADEEKVKAWVAGHPDFAATVGFVDPERAAKLWSGLVAESGRADGAWATGPLSQLLAFAPFAVGNLNGLKAVDRNEFNRQTLRQFIEVAPPDSEQRKQLLMLEETLANRYQEEPRFLLSLFLDGSDGSPRASIGFGDVDNADQITTLTHGIGTNVGAIREWSTIAVSTQIDLQKELGYRDATSQAATVLFLEWDSGGVSDVQDIERSDAGAERMAQLQRGFSVSNAGAQRNLELHSLGTTMGMQMIADNPGLVRAAWLFGSAGIAERTAEVVSGQIREGEVTVHATHASDDLIAQFGRGVTSEHPLDPRDVEGVRTFSADGGWVEDYGAGAGEYGKRVEGHASTYADEVYDRVDDATFTRRGSMWIPPVNDRENAPGYFHPESQAYKQTVVDLADALVGQE